MKYYLQYILGLVLFFFSVSAFSSSSLIPSPNSLAYKLGPETFMDPCLTQEEAKVLISHDHNQALIFDKKKLKKIVEKNQDAMSKLKLIGAERILVLPAAYLGLTNKCNQGVQVYFTFIDE